MAEQKIVTVHKREIYVKGPDADGDIMLDLRASAGIGDDGEYWLNKSNATALRDALTDVLGEG